MREKTVLVTGASRGIGAAVARAFANAGYRVAVNYNASKAEAEALAAQWPDRMLPVQADVADRAQVEAMFRQVEEAFGGVDVLVCNAGIARQELFTDVTPAAWQRMLDVHLSGAFHCCQCALPHMLHQKWGRIVTVSSMWGQVGGSCEVAYSAAKAGLIGLTRALAKEEGPSGITANCVAPGVIETDMTAALSAEDKAGMAEVLRLMPDNGSGLSGEKGLVVRDSVMRSLQWMDRLRKSVLMWRSSSLMRRLIPS